MSQIARTAISFPADGGAAAALLRAAPASHLRAGGTDLQERRHLGIAPGALIDLRDAAGMEQIQPAPESEKPGTLQIGALCRIQVIADSPLLRQQAPVLALAAGALATPQIRAVGTLGGNLAQHTRCWYYRSADWDCLKKGGTGCPAVAGDHRWHAVFPHTGCAAVHASTLAVALLVADAEIQAGEAWTTLESWLSDKNSADQTGGSPSLIQAVRIAVSLPDEKVSYHRAISRARAEWPLVECAVRLRVEGGTIRLARIAVGAVAAVPMRLRKVEAMLEGQPPTPEILAAAAARATDGADPLPGTQYKLALLSGCVLECLEQAL
jgi:xanthine dehydrogenase YagS FAD-binding subunit